MKKEFVCISCPVGCRLTVWEDEDGAGSGPGQHLSPRKGLWRAGVHRAHAHRHLLRARAARGAAHVLGQDRRARAQARIPEVLAAIRRGGRPQRPCAWATASSRTSQAPAQTSWPQGALRRKSAKEKASGARCGSAARPPFVFAPLSGASVAQARTRPPPQTAALPRQRAGTSGRRSTRRTRG